MELIAMKCTREQYESVKDKVGELKWKYSDDFTKYNYFCNLETGGVLISKSLIFNNRKIYRKFNKKILFKALDIEVEETFKISKETVLKYDMRDEFPECFEVKLEVGKVYRNVGTMFLCTGFSEKLKPYGYGFSCDNLFLEDCRKYTWGTDCVKEATQKEWKEALVKEAERKFKVGDVVKCLHYEKTSKTDFEYCILLDDRGLWYGGKCVFKDGVWAEVVKNEIIVDGLTYILK